MSEGVRADGLADPGLYGERFHQVEDRHAGKATATRVQEHQVLRLCMHRQIGSRSFFDVHVHLTHGLGTDGHQAFLVALADHADEAIIEMQPGAAQAAELAYAQSAAVQGLDHGTVAVRQRLAHVDGLYHAIDLVHAEEHRELACRAWALHQFRGVFLHDLLPTQAAVESTDRHSTGALGW